MKEYLNPLTNKICSILSPLVGDMMANGIIKSQVNKVHLSEESISLAHLPILAEGIERGLVIFLGSDVAKQVVDKIKEIK
jgi:hypothetical protein